jgi:hypothetical protein
MFYDVTLICSINIFKEEKFIIMHFDKSSVIKIVLYAIEIALLTWIVSDKTLRSKLGIVGKFVLYFLVLYFGTQLNRRLFKKK